MIEIPCPDCGAQIEVDCACESAMARAQAAVKALAEHVCEQSR